jgi:uncharacterized protein with ParB-like and HNH nuclease domain
MSLQEEIEQKAKEIHTDSYAMSIGELINMYRDDELQIQPDFQRFFRWTDVQKAKFIESILLGIPIPPVFVVQNKWGVWDVIDGLQRLSTIFEFIGILKDENGNLKPPNFLKGTKFLPSLEGKYWSDKNSDNPDSSFTKEQQIDFKRAKTHINIIKRSSDPDSKYELFQRLNTGGTPLTYQEIRNCLMIMLNKEFYNRIHDLSQCEVFENCVPLTEKQLSEQDNMEIVVRFLVYRYVNLDEVDAKDDMGDFLTDNIIDIINNSEYDLDREERVFKKTFDFLDKILSDDSFKKYNPNKNKFYGAFSISAFEALIVGISENIDKLEDQQKLTIDKIKKIYEEEEFIEAVRRGTRAVDRYKKLAKFSKNYFRI